MGLWVSLTAESAVFTLWPPAPPDLKTSHLRSSSLTSKADSSMSGVISTRAKDVSRVLPELKGESRTRRWTPFSCLR